MNKIMLKFLKQYKDNVLSATVLNEDSALDYYVVKYVAWVVDVYSSDMGDFEYDGQCKVSVDEFNKFRKIEEAVIWE
jgi:hypothetical protein